MKLPNPLIAGFNPDPSVVRVGDEYFLVTSTFEYLPGVPVYRSVDLVEWTQIGHVITRSEQFEAAAAPTGGGVWAPTIRWRDGLFHVIVAAAGAGTRVYSATDQVGPWSDGTLIDGLNGIDPDLAWDDDGTCYVTFSGPRAQRRRCRSAYGDPTGARQPVDVSDAGVAAADVVGNGRDVPRGPPTCTESDHGGTCCSPKEAPNAATR